LRRPTRRRRRRRASRRRRPAATIKRAPQKTPPPPSHPGRYISKTRIAAYGALGSCCMREVRLQIFFIKMRLLKTKTNRETKSRVLLCSQN
jgi:hypothetical protein